MPNAKTVYPVAGSFRDPSGTVFVRDGIFYRQVNWVYRPDYELLIGSGLYDALARDGRLLPHTEAALDRALAGEAYKVIEPQPLPFVSYPCEWCFGQLKDAALLTLEIQARALEFGMALKDASAYNVQFVDGRPVLIDTLSFAEYREGQPWVAYRQFCEQFLAPLTLMSCTDVRLSHLLRAYVDGLPLDLVSHLLPARTWAGFSFLSHVHLHARAQKRYADSDLPPTRAAMSRTALLALIDSLRRAVDRLVWKPAGTEWSAYYATCGYEHADLEHKQSLVSDFLASIRPAPRTVWDLGANTGLFSRLASGRGMYTLALDSDPAAVETNYRQVCRAAEPNLLPLVVDLTNPTPAFGWANLERPSLLQRGPADAALALALVHHLAIGHNVPLDQIAAFLHQLCHFLIIEFIPKSDHQAQKLLRHRQDIFVDYDLTGFERAFGAHFALHERQPIGSTGRVLYLMSRSP